MSGLQYFDGAVSPEAPLAQMSLGELGRMRRVALERGLASRAEAEALVAADRAHPAIGPEWAPFFALALADYVVWQCRPTGRVSEADADWLLGVLGDQPTPAAAAALLLIVREADGAPERLAALALRAGGMRA